MATGSDQVVGYGMVTLAASIFTYYTVWVVVLPFVAPGHVMHSLFLPRGYALLIPIGAGVVAIMGLAVFMGMITMRKKQNAKEKSS